MAVEGSGNRTLHVTSVPDRVDVRELDEALKIHCPGYVPESVRLMRSKKCPREFVGFIDMDGQETADAAIKALSRKEIPLPQGRGAYMGLFV
uniref:RRM domain-containing protein n=1 Tax=Chromera velia CCMP2878 TaxID=1169474 RepID=A0A0G4I0V7_9ALVE|eukprot:Cvel_34474.t1-p1 / transcript=Cvel_34474.t1 / gene=Cvel_34474 / organism=Chromera_velia_CCMP2878 / gene_product=hypothetical protein / transcript_product=hypothetical protein / location=Cvel_scaffold5936:2950-3383(+) / protein_length=91 / sequence_SO=supercontig / SO=protein_coding / is_pseudo=false